MRFQPLPHDEMMTRADAVMAQFLALCDFNTGTRQHFFNPDDVTDKTLRFCGDKVSELYKTFEAGLNESELEGGDNDLLLNGGTLLKFKDLLAQWPQGEPPKALFTTSYNNEQDYTKQDTLSQCGAYYFESSGLVLAIDVEANGYGNIHATDNVILNLSVFNPHNETALQNYVKDFAAKTFTYDTQYGLSTLMNKLDVYFSSAQTVGLHSDMMLGLMLDNSYGGGLIAAVKNNAIKPVSRRELISALKESQVDTINEITLSWFIDETTLSYRLNKDGREDQCRLDLASGKLELIEDDGDGLTEIDSSLTKASRLIIDHALSVRNLTGQNHGKLSTQEEVAPDIHSGFLG